MIVLDGIGKRYGRGPAVLHAVHAQIAPAAPLVVQGENGAGKSTLLRIIAGCSRPTRGTVRGRPETATYVPERFPAVTSLRVRTYLRRFVTVLQPRSATLVDRAEELLHRLGFTSSSRTPVLELSQGNAQKLALAAALSPGSGLFVLDEPWAGLDATARDELVRLLGETTETTESATPSCTVVVTDHTGAAVNLPRRELLVLENGVRREQDVPAEKPEHHAPAAGEAPCVEITLCGHDEDELPESPTHRGIVEAVYSSTGVRLRVRAAHSDSVLTRALELGWSVRTVHAVEDGDTATAEAESAETRSSIASRSTL